MIDSLISSKVATPANDAQYIMYILVIGALCAWFLWLKWGQKKYTGEERRSECVTHSEEMLAMKKDIEHLQEGQTRIETKVDKGFSSGDARMKALEDSVQALAVRMASIKCGVLEAIQQALKDK